MQCVLPRQQGGIPTSRNMLTSLCGWTRGSRRVLKQEKDNKLKQRKSKEIHSCLLVFVTMFQALKRKGLFHKCTAVVSIRTCVNRSVHIFQSELQLKLVSECSRRASREPCGDSHASNKKISSNRSASSDAGWRGNSPTDPFGHIWAPKKNAARPRFTSQTAWAVSNICEEHAWSRSLMFSAWMNRQMWRSSWSVLWRSSVHSWKGLLRVAPAHFTHWEALHDGCDRYE